MTDMFLVVGQDASGRQIALGDSVKTVGRHKGADLVVRDASVSRRHIEASSDGTRVELKLVDGAQPFYFRGKPTKHARLEVGEYVIVGSTVLTVMEAGAESPPSSRRDPHSDVATMLEGFAVEVQGLAAVVRLVEAIKLVPDRPALEAAVVLWGQRSGVASGASLVVEAPDEEALSSRGRSVTVRLPGVAMGLRLQTPNRVDDALRGVALVAAQVIGAKLTELEKRAALEDDIRALRAMSLLGSAREFLGDSPAARDVARIVPKLATSASTALLLGESGTGKTFVARLIHEASGRRDAPLRVVNCAAIPESLVESELFGAERGALTGAVATRVGAFEAAGTGTVLLDEIGELPMTSQAKLLRVLEDRKFERVGSNHALPFEARVIAATNRDLDAMVKKGTFRADLLFRIGVINVRIPSLRERGGDVVMLARRMLADLAMTSGRRVEGFTPAALESIRRYPWPGNVRELRNAVEHALVLGDDKYIDARDLPDVIRTWGEAASSDQLPPDQDLVRLPIDLAALEARAIEAALRATNNNRTRAAALLGINRVTLQKKLRRELE